MQRKFFDVFASAIGLVMVVALVVAGSLLMWGYSFADSNVHNQLAAQDITFPTAAEFAHAVPGTEITPQMLPYLLQYAGQPLTDRAHRPRPTRITSSRTTLPKCPTTACTPR